MPSWRLVFASLILFTGIGHAQVTAYAALRTVGANRGEKALSQILAVSGEATNAQPAHWKIWLDDPAARGGVRELEISDNQITSERTPVKSEWAGAKDMNLAQLNVDSDGALKTATQEARAKGIEFSKVQFQLAVDRDTGKPGWTLQMSDANDQRLGAIKINADSGTISTSAWGQGTPNLLAQRKTSENADEQFLNSPEAQLPAHHTQQEEGVPVAKAVPSGKQNTPRYAQEQEEPNNSGEQPESLGDRARRYATGAENFGRSVVNRIERPFLRAGGWIQKKVTGQDTISPQSQSNSHDDDDDDDDDNRSSDQQYNKPVQVPR
jgi:hypothetical protein